MCKYLAYFFFFSLIGQLVENTRGNQQPATYTTYIYILKGQPSILSKHNDKMFFLRFLERLFKCQLQGATL